MKPAATQPTAQRQSLLQFLLLDLISPNRAVTQAHIDALAEPDWQALLTMVGQHRLGPLLHWQLAQAHTALRLPPEITATLAAVYKQSAFRNLTLQRELLLVNKILNQASIPCIALKGAYLASYVYPHLALRPLRDLDILVQRASLLVAYQSLIAAGLARIDSYQGMPDAATLLKKHLPPLRSVSGQVTVELHGRLFDPSDDTALNVDLSDEPSFWERSTKAALAHQTIAYESPTDLLLHLVVHAVYEHHFNNGPLTLSDLAFLINTHAIDWPLFWDMARARGQTRGCRLLLKLTQRYWRVESISWEADCEDHSVSDAVLDIAAQLMLCDVHASSYVKLNAELASGKTSTRATRVVWRKIFPSKTYIAAAHPVSPANWTVYIGYWMEWRRLLTNWLAAFRYTRRKPHVQQDIRHMAAFKHWLD